MTQRLVLQPITLRAAQEWVACYHRHSKPPQGMKFALGAAQGDDLVGVGIVGRPVARNLDDGWTLEVLRICTTGEPNVCSFLYGACWRAARALGYRKLVSYTLASEPGTSLRAAGWRVVGEVKPQTWDRPSRARDPGHPQQRLRWEVAV
jgi:hypothetical protein